MHLHAKFTKLKWFEIFILKNGNLSCSLLGVAVEIKFYFSCKLGNGFDKGSVSEQINNITELKKHVLDIKICTC